ncbi:MAG: hypothetical protein GEU94_08815 [Micromonosporaceae bacterium]|nr:hypothetical protein [Micromonosporaceae bacterium]
MTAPPLSSFAGQVVQFAAPLLRIRYPDALYVSLHGFPDWTPYARAMVEIAPPAPEAPAEAVRVMDVLAANQVMAESGDPLWGAAQDEDAPPTPDGWVWAHLAMSRRLALVPAEAHAAFRHAGGIATLEVDHSGAGVSVGEDGAAVAIAGGGEATESDLAALESKLGAGLPAAYRQFLEQTNGGRPAAPAVHHRFGFVADQSFFGIGRKDWFGNVANARQWLRDQFSDEFLPVGHVQGGVLAVRVADPDAGSVWYYDDDDPRDRESYDAQEVGGRLLRRCAVDFAAFLAALRPVPDALRDAARDVVRGGLAQQVTVPQLGLALPADRRPATGQPPAGRR